MALIASGRDRLQDMVNSTSSLWTRLHHVPINFMTLALRYHASEFTYVADLQGLVDRSVKLLVS